jgi:hypothetical protein
VCKTHAQSYILIYGLSASATFFHILTNNMIIGGGGELLNKKWVS